MPKSAERVEGFISFVMADLLVFLLGADFVSAGGQYFLWPFKHSHLCCICCSSVISEHLRHCFIIGVSPAADTLFAQFYDTERHKEMGYTLQKAILVYIPYI